MRYICIDCKDILKETEVIISNLGDPSHQVYRCQKCYEKAKKMEPTFRGKS